jgi:hypothetical protein
MGLHDPFEYWQHKLWPNESPKVKLSHYNKRCPCTPTDFTGFWVNSLVVVNEDQWRSSEFIRLMNGD